MATLRLTVNDLIIRVSDYLGYSNNAAPTGTELTVVKDIVARGYRRFLYPIDVRTGQAYEWSFLRELYTLVLTDGVWKYQLPENFSEVMTHPVYDDDDNYRPMQRRTPEQILDMRSIGTYSYAPMFYAVVPTKPNNETGQYDEIWVYGDPDSTYRVKFFIRLDPLKPDATTEFLVGGVRACEAILESCLGVADEQENDRMGMHSELASKLTQDLIVSDSSKDEETVIGNLHSGKEPRFYPHSNSTIKTSNLFPQ